MKTVLSIAATAMLLIPALAQGFEFNDIEMREKWSKNIMDAKKGGCDGQDEENVGKKLSYAASLIMHGEYFEAKESINRARENASSENCREAILKASKPGK